MNARLVNGARGEDVALEQIAQPLNSKLEKKAFYRMVLFLALPIVGQNVIDAMVTSADVVMLGFVSQEALSAVSLAGNVQFVLSLFLFGMATGSAMLSSQYWGKGDIRTIEKVLGIALRFSLAVGALFSVCALSIPQYLMRIFTPDEALITEGIVYLRTVALTYLFAGFTVMYLNVMRSMERVSLSTVVYAVSFVTNVALNALFIFVMRWGAFGVALATLIARCVELVICIIHAARNERFRVHISDIFARHGLLLKDFIHYSLPAIGNDVVWGVAFTMYSVIIGHLSSDAVAAYSIVAVARKLGTVMCFALSAATAIIVGKSLGADRFDEAKAYAKRFLNLSILSALVGGVIILALIPVFMHMADLTENARGYLFGMLLINSYYVLGQAINTTTICGIFRAGGDSRWGFYCDIIDMWAVMVPIGFLCAFVLKLDVMWVYFILCLDEFIKLPFNIVHYRRRGWLKNITREMT